MSYRYHAKRLADKHTEARSYGRDMYPLCWNAKLHNTSLDFDKVLKKLVSCPDYGFHNEADVVACVKDMEELRDEWGSQCDYGGNDNMGTFIIEDMRRIFTGAEDGTPEYDSMRVCSPKVYKRFGLSGYVGTWEPRYEFVGRSSGWLALIEFEGFVIKSNEPFEHDFVPDRRIGSRWYQKLCCQIASTTNMVNARDDEYMYQAAFRLNQIIEELR